MGENSKEVNLDVGLKTISNIMREVSKIDDFSHKAERLDFYVHLMEQELNKIDALKHDLPHCMYLLKHAIEMLKEENLWLKGKKMGPVIKELISLNCDSKGKRGAKGSNDISNKESWMSSVNLWYQEEEGCGSASHFNACSFKNRGGAFVPYKKPSVTEKEERVLPTDGYRCCRFLWLRLNLEIRVKKKDCGFVKSKQQQPHQKKQRRCWSLELHRRFVDALEQLGGEKSAKPKQIRDFMKVDGLTNNAVKSNLQKFRLHIRDTPTSSASLVDYSTLAPNACSNMSTPMVAHSSSPLGPFPRGGGANKGGSTSGGGMMEGSTSPQIAIKISKLGPCGWSCERIRPN